MSTTFAVKVIPPNMIYVFNKKKIYADALKKLNKADRIFVVPINYVDKMDPTKTIPSLIYISSQNYVFIFDLIMLKEKGLPKELLDIIKSEKIKLVFCEKLTFNLLGFDKWDDIPNIVDVEPVGERLSPFFGNGTEASGSGTSESSGSGLRVSEVDWSVRPFKSNEQFMAGNRVYKLMLMFRDIK